MIISTIIFVASLSTDKPWLKVICVLLLMINIVIRVIRSKRR